MRRLAIITGLLVPLLAGARPAAAGIVNIQSILATEAKEGLSGALAGSLDWRTGNVSFLFLGATPVARYRAGDHLFVAIWRAEHRTSRGDTLVSRTFEHLRYRYSLTDFLLGEVFAQHEYDAIRRLELRALVGAGPKLDLLKEEGYGLSLGVAYMLEHERIKRDALPDAGQTSFKHRISSYVVGHYAIDERLQLVNTVYAQPKIDGPADFRLLNESQLVMRLTTKLALTVAFTAAFNSTPADTIENLDTTLINQVAYEF
jgi:putative salt-induced outer membrane protein YdiY